MAGHQDWADALDALERDVDAAERAASGEDPPPEEVVAAWAPRTDLGPLPEALAGRAQTLLERQHAAGRQLTSRLATLVGQRNLAARVSDATAGAPHRPVYLDLDA